MKVVLWDNDGVLVDTEPLYYQASKDVLSTVGVDLSKETYADISLKQGGSLMDCAKDRIFDEQEIRRLRNERDKRFSELIVSGVTIRKGVLQGLSQLKYSVQMGIVTSSKKHHFDLIHKSTGLLPFFEFILTREGFNRPKPHPDAYLTALENWKLKTENCIVVEDTERGLEAATAAGLPCIVFPHELSNFGNFSKARKIVNSFEEVVEEIMKWTTS